MKLLEQVEHRPWAIPERPWLLGQVWSKLLFAHWPIPAAEMQALIGPGLELDTFEGQAWVGVVPFRMSELLFGGRVPPPFSSRFEELNVRTYVTLDGKPGVYFFSLDASNFAAVAAARSLYHLPYFNARMSVKLQGEQVYYSSQRVHPNAPRPAEFEGSYGPVGAIYRSLPGTLEHWLTERYCLYAVAGQGRVYRGEIHHQPWPLQPAQATFSKNTVALSHGIKLPDLAPVLHYAERLEVVAWSIRRVR